MTPTTTEIISKAESAFLNGKHGTFAIVRTPDDNKLWYAAPGIQSEVAFLRIRLQDRVIDEKTFFGTLIVRSDAKKDVQWFAYYTVEEKPTYFASSWDEIVEFSLTAIAGAPNLPGGNEDPITIQAAFSNQFSAVARVQNRNIARATVLQAQLFGNSPIESQGGTVNGESVYGQNRNDIRYEVI